MEGDADQGRLLDDPPLPELTPPPPGLIAVRGTQVVRVHHIDHPNPKMRGFTEVVVLAWARLPDGDWAGLCVWLATVQEPGPHGAHTTGRGRFGWLRILPDRVEAWRPPHRYLQGEHGWHGQGDPSEVSGAIARAAATLPEHLRAAALTPREPEQPA